MLKAVALAVAALPLAAYSSDPAALTPGTVELSASSTLRVTTGTTKVTPDLPDASTVETDTAEYLVDLAGFYYVTPNLGLGLSLGYDKETEDTAGDDTRTQLFLVGPALALNVPVAPSLAVFGRGTIGYATSRIWGEDIPDLQGAGYGYAVQAGIRYFPLAQLSLDLGVSYAYTKLTTDATTTPVETVPEITATSGDLSLTVGISVFLGR